MFDKACVLGCSNSYFLLDSPRESADVEEETVSILINFLIVKEMLRARMYTKGVLVGTYETDENNEPVVNFSIRFQMMHSSEW